MVGFGISGSGLFLLIYSLQDLLENSIFVQSIFYSVTSYFIYLTF